MVLGKKPNDMSNGSTKYKDQQPNMSYQRKDANAGGAGKNDGRSQNGNSNSFRTDGAISGARNQGEGRTLQKWQPDGPADTDGSLESGTMRSSGGVPWDQFAEHERRFNVTSDYDENIYTTPLNKSHPNYKQRVLDADRTAKEIINKTAFNSHVAEERVQDNLGGEDGADEEEKYSGVRRQQDFPPLAPSNSGNKYTPPARRPPTGQATVKGAPVDPAIISSQLARPEKPAAEKGKASPTPAIAKPEIATPPTTATSSVTAATPETKATSSNTPSFTSRTASPNVRPEGAPNATATVEKDVTIAFKGFAAQQRKNVDQLRSAKARNDKEIKLNDLKKFADSFKLHTPVPKDLVSIIAKDPVKQKEIQEKAKRNAEEAKANPSEAAKPVAPPADARPAARPVPVTHGTSPSNVPSRQNTNRNAAFGHQGPYNNSQSSRNDRPQSQQPMPAQQNRQPAGNLAGRLRNIEASKQSQVPNPIPVHETRLPPTGPSNLVEPNFSRRSSGVASAQGARLNPNSSEFRPSPHAPTFSPNGNPSTGSSPRSATTLVDQPTPPVKRSLLRRVPVPESERPSIKDKFDALEYTKSLKPALGKTWEATGGIKPAYDTFPTWRQLAPDEKPNSTMHLTYAKYFDSRPYPVQPMSPPNQINAVPQVAHQYQLPLHMQQNVHRGSPRQPPVNMHSNQHGHGPTPPFNGADDHRMMPSHSAQSYSSPRLQQSLPMAYQPPMGQSPQMYNPQMISYQGGAPPMQQYRSLSQSHQFGPQQHMGQTIMMPNPANGFMTAQGMAGGPQMMFPPAQGQFMPPGNGPPVMPPNGYPSPGRNAAPLMMSQGSQQGHPQPMYAMNTPGMSPGPQYGSVTPMYAQQGPVQMPMRGYNGQNQFGTSPQQMHQFAPQRNNHPNGNYNNKSFQHHGQHPNGPPNNQIPTGPQARADVGDESK